MLVEHYVGTEALAYALADMPDVVEMLWEAMVSKDYRGCTARYGHRVLHLPHLGGLEHPELTLRANTTATSHQRSASGARCSKPAALHPSAATFAPSIDENQRHCWH